MCPLLLSRRGFPGSDYLRAVIGRKYYRLRRRNIYNVYFVLDCRVMGSAANLILIHGYVLSSLPSTLYITDILHYGPHQHQI